MSDVTTADMEFPRPGVAAEAIPSERVKFIQRTYLHLATAILAFAGIEAALIMSGVGETVAEAMLSVSWIGCLLAFMVVSWIAEKWARSSTSVGLQYLGLGVFIVAEAFIFLPLLYIVNGIGKGEVIGQAANLTLVLFGALTAVALFTRKDFSFLGSILAIGGLIAMGVIVFGIISGFGLGLWFSAIMVVFASAAILYSTSNVLHHYRTDQHVAASLSLFAGVALLFWYLIQVVLSFSNE